MQEPAGHTPDCHLVQVIQVPGPDPDLEADVIVQLVPDDESWLHPFVVHEPVHLHLFFRPTIGTGQPDLLPHRVTGSLQAGDPHRTGGKGGRV